jgi:NADH dehydrogenase [ubiquinone] 1 alpha subcomplex assembly factor 6
MHTRTAGVGSREADHAASHLGKAVGIALLLRGTPFQASRRRSYLPLELCAQHGVSQEDVYRGNVSEGLRDVTLGVASAAMAHLQEARRLLPRLPRPAPPVLQQGTLAGLYLGALEKAGFNVFDPSLAAGGGATPLRRMLALKWNALRGTV